MNYGSPYNARGATPTHNPDFYFSESQTPSPKHHPSPHPYEYYTPPRPQTRASHFRHASSGGQEQHRATFSPRYNSSGQYGTVHAAKVSSRKQSFSKPKGSNQSPKRERRNSYSYYRTSHGDSDEDEIFEVDGITYVLPAQSRSRRYHEYYAGHGTDHYYYKQDPIYSERSYDYERAAAYYAEPIHRSATRVGHSRRQSSGGPIPRPQTTRPTNPRPREAAAPPARRKATDADARKHKIPEGYSLKNWDPSEEPITLLGSVFDANSLGKWIYDWACYRHGAGAPISDMAGDLWLLLITLSGKVKSAEDIMHKVRREDCKEILEDFIESGERLMDRLRSLLKRCEAPMLKASKRKDSTLGKISGVEFVETMFGIERENDRTQALMQAVRLWDVRFEANCADIIKRPTA